MLARAFGRVSAFSSSFLAQSIHFRFKHHDEKKTKDEGRRITRHPVLDVPKGTEVTFSWNGKTLTGFKGEMLSTSLIANGIDIMGHHHRDGSPQGIFCANGQCSQCMVIIDGVAAKSCMTPLHAGMKVEELDGVPKVPADDVPVPSGPMDVKDVDVLIVGGGPSGLMAAIELGKLNISTLLIDDKNALGGKLVLQTHKFFGTKEDTYAGTRGYKIGGILEKKLRKYSSVEVWLNSVATGVFEDDMYGVQKKLEDSLKPTDSVVGIYDTKDSKYKFVRPKRLLVATGAREKFLNFPGNTIPGVIGAGAFQTLVNRDLVRPCKRCLIVGGGNVGLIAGYHALQAGIEVAALIEALPECGGYAVHAEKLQRMGVPILTRHTIVEVTGKDCVESATIAQLNDKWEIVPGTMKKYNVDSVLVAVGLDPVDDFYKEAKEQGLKVWVAGDAEEVAEASSAMISGTIRGIEIAKSLGVNVGPIPPEWRKREEIFKARPGPLEVRADPEAVGHEIIPVFHCFQEIPCNACTTACELSNLTIEDDGIVGVPTFCLEGECDGCSRCEASCPGLAVTIVDYREDKEYPTVSIPFEFFPEMASEGTVMTLTDRLGESLGKFPVKAILRRGNKTYLVKFQVPDSISRRAAGIRIQEDAGFATPEIVVDKEILNDDAIVCRCERVTAGEIRRAIRSGVRDFNELKHVTRAGMGACGSKTCYGTITRMFREEGVKLEVERSIRPMFVEVPLRAFVEGLKKDE